MTAEKLPENPLSPGEISIKRVVGEKTGLLIGYACHRGIGDNRVAGYLYQPQLSRVDTNEFSMKLSKASERLGISVAELREKLNRGEEIRYFPL